MKKWLKRMTQDWYLDVEPRYFQEITNFSHAVDYKGYNPKIHHTRGIDPRNNIVEFISCWSGCTIWAFADKATKKRPEIANRKSRILHPQKFLY